MEAYLTQISNHLLRHSWQIAILAVVVAAVSWLLRNRSAHVRYLLWLIVLAKCLVPPLTTIPLAILPVEKPAMTFEVPEITIEKPVIVASSPEPVPRPPAPMLIEPRPALNVRQWLSISWIAGAFLFVIVALVKAWRTNRWLRKKRRPLPNIMQAGIENLFSDAGITTFPKVWFIKGIGQPFVWGLLRGSIYLPTDFVKINNVGQQRSILGHELSHILRFDAAVNTLQVVAQAIFWFHPFVWWANKRTRAEREKCCDEMTIARLGTQTKEYSKAIVNMLISEHKHTQPVPSLAIAGPVKNIEERIKTMLRPGKKFYKRPSLIAATAVLTLALLTVPTTLILSARAQSKAVNLSLHEAAAKGDIDQVKSLISKGANVNSKDYRLGMMGMTSLHYAAEHGHKDIVELLIAKGADINAKDQQGDTPVIWAIAGRSPNSKEVVQLLTANGAQVSTIHIAAYLGDVGKVRTALNQGTDVDAKWVHDATPLHFAVGGGKREVIELLIDQGADLNVSADGLTPLHAAVMAGNTEAIKLLIDKGADVNASGKSGVRLLGTLEMDIMRTLELLQPGKDEQEAMRLWWESKRDAVKSLVAMGARIPARVVALGASVGLKEMVELSVNAGADVNARARFRQKKTLLHEAVESGHKELVQYLLDKGADINAKDRRGWTSLHMAAVAGRRELVELLLAGGADFNIGDIRGGTALWYAKEQGNEEIIELLRSHGAKEEAPTISLHQAARDGDLEQVKSLISRGADINAMDDRLAGTPLHLAAYYAHHDVVEFLISKGADVNARNKWNRTAINEAVDKGHIEIAELLRKHGAKAETFMRTEKTKSAKSLLENAASKFVIPKRNLEIPEQMKSCTDNLRKIYAAIKKYEKDKGTLPNWLSDLVPDYVSTETLLCPHNPVHEGRLRYDPRLPCSYGYGFRMDRARVNFQGSPLGGVTMRDWKTAEVELFGDVVPLVRCYGHGRILNLAVSGEIYLSSIVWAPIFIPGYKQYEIFKLLEESSR